MVLYFWNVQSYFRFKFVFLLTFLFFSALNCWSNFRFLLFGSLETYIHTMSTISSKVLNANKYFPICYMAAGHDYVCENNLCNMSQLSFFFCFYCSRESFRLIGVKNICCSSFFPCWSSPKLLFASDLYSFEVDAWRLVLSPLCYGCKTTPNLARILLNSTEHFPDKDEKPLSLASRGVETLPLLWCEACQDCSMFCV